MKKLLLIVFAAALLFGGWYLATPWLAMKGIVDAAQAGDAEALEERIDFERLRSEMRADLADSRDDGDNGLLDQIGDRLVRGLGGVAIDAGLTPRGITSLVNAGALALPLVPDRFRGQDISWDVERDGLGSFRGVSTWEDGSDGPVMNFERDGLGWELVGVQLIH